MKRVIVVATVLVGIPAVFALWFGLIMLADHLNVETTANEILTWIIAAITAIVLWPLGTRRLYRSFRRNRVRSIAQRGTATQTPRVPLKFSDACGRIFTILVGAAALFLFCVSQQFTIGVQDLLAVGSSGRRSAWMLLQILTGALAVALLIPALWLTGRTLRGAQRGSPEHLRLELRQDWYAAATIAWALSLMSGFLFSNLILTLL